MKLDHQGIFEIKKEVKASNCYRPNNCDYWTVKKQLALGIHSNLVCLININDFVNNFLFNNNIYMFDA